MALRAANAKPALDRQLRAAIGTADPRTAHRFPTRAVELDARAYHLRSGDGAYTALGVQGLRVSAPIGGNFATDIGGGHAFYGEVGTADTPGRAVVNSCNTFGSAFSELGVIALAPYTAGWWHERDSRRGITTSSQNRFTGLRVSGDVKYGIKIGNDDPDQRTLDCSLTSWIDCTVTGFGPRAHTGVYVGSEGAWGNNLNHDFVNCTAIGWGHGVGVECSNVSWRGGTLQNNSAADVWINQGTTGPCAFDFRRSEHSGRLLSTYTDNRAHCSLVSLANVEWRADALLPDGCFIDWQLEGRLTVSNLRAFGIGAQVAGGKVRVRVARGVLTGHGLYLGGPAEPNPDPDSYFEGAGAVDVTDLTIIDAQSAAIVKRFPHYTRNL